MVKTKYKADAVQAKAIIEKTQQLFPDAKLNTSDGCRFDLPDGWLAAAVDHHAEHLVSFDRDFKKLLPVGRTAQDIGVAELRSENTIDQRRSVGGHEFRINERFAHGRHLVVVFRHVELQRDADLMQVVAALRPSCRFTGSLYRRQQQRHQGILS